MALDYYRQPIHKCFLLKVFGKNQIFLMVFKQRHVPPLLTTAAVGDFCPPLPDPPPFLDQLPRLLPAWSLLAPFFWEGNVKQ